MLSHWRGSSTCVERLWCAHHQSTTSNMGSLVVSVSTSLAVYTARLQPSITTCSSSHERPCRCVPPVKSQVNYSIHSPAKLVSQHRQIPVKCIPVKCYSVPVKYYSVPVKQSLGAVSFSRQRRPHSGPTGTIIYPVKYYSAPSMKSYHPLSDLSNSSVWSFIILSSGGFLSSFSVVPLSFLSLSVLWYSSHRH